MILPSAYSPGVASVQMAELLRSLNGFLFTGGPESTFPTITSRGLFVLRAGPGSSSSGASCA